MKLIPLGGAEEVGATCTLLEIGGHKILVDAGIRIGHPDPLPDLSRITDFGGIEAILVTHAHTDHTGALPVVHRAYPAAPVYATPGTQAIISVLMQDALNLMKSRYDNDREIPLYNKELVDGLFSRMQPVQLGQTVRLFGGNIAATFFPAGHILGAACIGLESANGESAFISGDISVTPQLTVGGMLPPVTVDRRFRPQVVMVESTYGNRLHANRAAEERRMVETINEVVENGGRVLIPAFAVGRAQEVLLILANAMARKAIPPFPVWVDGMVRSVCNVYTQHPYDLATALRRQINTRGNPFFGANAGVKEAEFTSINTPDERTKLAESGTPGCIVASSGMLSGGPSAFYARYIAREEKSAIFITGYQDEESPGRALLALAEATTPADRVLKLDGETVPVVCRVGKYSLSAHVDAGEVAGLIEQLNPQETILVHGAGGAREALSELLQQGRAERRVYLPHADDELTFEPRRKQRRPVTAATPESAAADLPYPVPAPEQLAELRLKILAANPRDQNRAFTVQEVARLWLESTGATQTDITLSPEVYGELREILSKKESGFLPDPRRPFLFRLIKAGSVQEAKIAKEAFPLEQNAALNVVSEKLPASTGLYRKGAFPTERRLVLYFHFPVIAAQKYTAQIEEITRLTGWTVEINPETHQGALVEAFQRLLPPELISQKTPAVYRELKEVKVVVRSEAAADETTLQELRNSYLAETGFSLQITIAGAVPAAPYVAPLATSNEPRMEINAAYATIEKRLATAGAKLYRRGLKQGVDGAYIEVAFISAEYGERFRPTLDLISAEIGWPLAVNPEPHQQNMQQLALQTLKEVAGGSYGAKKVQIHRDRREVVVKLDKAAPDLAELNLRAGEFFREQSGWGIRLEV